MDVSEWISGDYLNAEDLKRVGMVVRVTGEAKVVKKTFEGEEREALEIPVALEDEEQSAKAYSANRTTARVLIGAWSSETASWIGKRIRFQTVKQRVRGQMRDVLYGEPVEAKLVVL